MFDQADITSFYHSPPAGLDDERKAGKIEEIQQLTSRLRRFFLKGCHVNFKILQMEGISGFLLSGTHGATRSAEEEKPSFASHLVPAFNTGFGDSGPDGSLAQKPVHHGSKPDNLKAVVGVVPNFRSG